MYSKTRTQSVLLSLCPRADVGELGCGAGQVRALQDECTKEHSMLSAGCISEDRHKTH